ncbi:hypothetical protein [Halorientalis marina]|uniref:hypothetical protein n=1 Tax=Halorientalis marina TaxID=2931976 RepID=UPI001FF2463F|nr:hypothetical protein [Halorientalis marina]
MDIATELNGKEPRGFHRAVEVVAAYLDVLQQNVTDCPDCGGELHDEAEDSKGHWFELPEGKWYCPDCDTVLDVWDYLDVDNRDSASIPSLPSGVQLRFECDHEHDDSGMISGESSQDTHSRQSHTTDTDDYWQDGTF